MDRRSLALLELPVVLARLADAAASEPGRALCLALEPSADEVEVEERQALTDESLRLVDHGTEPDLAGVHDVRQDAAVARRGGALAPHALHLLAVTIRAAIAARAALDGLDGLDHAPRLTGVASGIDPELAPLAETIARAVADDGSDLRDGASPALRRLRRELREGRARIAERLRSLARDPSLRDHLQDDFVTERAGRPVLALRASARGMVPGIVHDTSGSRQTLFVEPLAVVDASNRLREAESAEREEVARILGELSRAVGDHAGALAALVEAAAEIDLALARGRLSRGWRGAQVTVCCKVVLRAVRHPLLDANEAVPIDLELGDLRAVVISGPNTGGKTVALKTLGLAALLHQCGLRPPAAHVELPVFDRVLADIGDEQSIAMSLSTFSGHVRNLVAILDQATDRSLVLLDEVAAGTDPVEGAALAEALLDRLARQARLTVATSHYQELKEWAGGSEAATNAATGFDATTEAPLYRIALGRPGTSHALRIAAGLGLPPELIEDATRHIAPEHRRMTELLAETERAAVRGAAEHARAAAERVAAEAARRAAEARAVELEREIERLRASAAAERERVLRAAEQELRTTRAELDALRGEIRAARRLERERRSATTPRALAKERERDRRLGAASERATRAAHELHATDTPLAVTTPLAPGDPVVAPSLGVRGTIAEIVRDEAVVLGRGGLRVRVPLDRLRPDRDGRADAVSDEQPVTVHAPTPTDAASELDVRGRTAQEAREALRAFVDTAVLAGHEELRVIHGRGTGVVRAAVRDELVRHPLVSAHEPDSADGATVVRLG